MQAYDPPAVSAAVPWLIAAGALLSLAMAALCARIAISGSVERRLRRQRLEGYVRRRHARREAKDNRAEMRRKQINNKLKALRQSKRHSSRLGAAKAQLMRAGFDVPVARYWLGCVMLGLAASLAYLGAAHHPFGLPVAFALAAFWLPSRVLKTLAKRRQKAFTKHFSDAVDVLVRGLRSGLPVGECFRIIARESPDPVGSEFRIVLDEHHAGLTMEEALERCYERMPTHELRFFATVIAIQSQTGGNLAEILANISSVLRGRAQLREKIKALSGEARASSLIIGSLPFIIGTVLYFVNQQYIMILWSTRGGNMVLGLAACLMVLGVWIMNKMGQLDM